MPAVASIPVFTVAKMFALGVASVIQDFTAVCGGDLESILAALYLMVHAPSCQHQFTPAQCAKIREMENKTLRA